MSEQKMPRTAAEYAERAAKTADRACMVMNEAAVEQFRDRAFEELCLAISDLATAVALIGRREGG